MQGAQSRRGNAQAKLEGLLCKLIQDGNLSLLPDCWGKKNALSYTVNCQQDRRADIHSETV